MFNPVVKMYVPIIVGIIFVMVLLYAVYRLYINHRVLDTSLSTSLTGGGDTFTITEGRNSLCIVDKDTNKLTKYYVENKSSTIEDMPLYIVVNGNVLEIRKHRELDMLKIIDSLEGEYYPKLYVNECCDMEFDQKLFESLPRYTIYDPEKIVIKRLVMEYLPCESLKAFMSKNGVKFEDRKLISNDMTASLMVDIYRQLFEMVYYFIDNNILPFDLDNVTNILIADGFKFKCIDCAVYATVEKRGETSSSDILIAWLMTIMYQAFCGRVNMVKILRMHPDREQITREALSGLVDKQAVDYIVDNIVNVDEKLAVIRNATIKRLLGDNDVNTCSVRNVIPTAMYDHDEIKRIVKDNESFAAEIDDLVLKANKRNDDDLKNIYRKIYSHPTSSASELEWLFMRVKSLSVGNVIENIAYIISHDSKTNEKLTLYYSDKCPCYGYENESDASSVHGGEIKTISTSRYIKLCPEYANVSISRTFIGYEQQDPKYNFDARHCMSAHIIPTEYFIFDFDVEDCLMYWCGILRGKSLYTTYAGLRLLCLDRPLFDEVLNAVRTIPEDEVRAKYSVNNVMKRAVSSIIKCTSIGIDFDEQFTSLMEYISTHQSNRGTLYRGENSYVECSLKVGDKLERKNIHTWSNNRLEAVRFCTDYYHCHDDLVRSRLLFVLDDAVAAKIHLAFTVPMDQIIDWIEFIHRPCVYTVTSIETITEHVEYDVDMNKQDVDMTVHVIHLREDSSNDK